MADPTSQLVSLAAERLAAESSARQAASKYDYVKVKVRLGDKLEHYYILSRFLVSRMLTVTRIPQYKAVKIALELKKQLVDSERLEITQDELESALFGVMRAKGFGDDYVRCFKMITRFYQEKRPLIVLISGSACTGKSTLAQKLASRLNLPNVLQTDVLCELLRASHISPLSATPLWERELDEEQLVCEFQAECAAIRKGLDGDLCKCIRDGKSTIIEGLHIDPGIYLEEFGSPAASGRKQQIQQQQHQQQQPSEHSNSSLHPMRNDALRASAQQCENQAAEATGSIQARLPATPPAAGCEVQAEVQVGRSLSFDMACFLSGSDSQQQSPWRSQCSSADRRRPSSAQPQRCSSTSQVTFMLRSSSSSGGLSPSISTGREVPHLMAASDGVGEESMPALRTISLAAGPSSPTTGDPGAAASTSTSAAVDLATTAGPVFVPVVLSVPDGEYESLARDWYSDQQAGQKAAQQQQIATSDEDVNVAAVMQRLRVLQRYLETREALGVPVVQVSAGGFGEAADHLHAYVLECIALALEQQHPAPAASIDG